MTKKLIAVALAVGLGSIVGVVGYLGHETELRSAPGATTLPAHAAFPDLSGRLQPLEQWRGKLLIVNFWATWCPPCREEIPTLIRIQDKYRDKGVVIVGIALDAKEAVEAYRNKTGINYPVLLGADDAMEWMKQAGNGMNAVPFTAILDPQGNLVAVKSGTVHEDQLEKQISQHLAAK